jgi:hypothetical protein
VRRLRSGQHPDTASALLAIERRGRSSVGRVTQPVAAPSTPPAQRAPTRRTTSGAQLLLAAGASAHELAVWRTLSQRRRTIIRAQLEAGGGSILSRVRRISRRRRARRR